MAERPADWAPGVREVPEVRSQLELLFKAVAADAIELAAPAFQKLIELADGRDEGKVKDAARRALLRLAARYPPDEVLGARKAKALSAGGEPPPMDANERYSHDGCAHRGPHEPSAAQVPGVSIVPQR